MNYLVMPLTKINKNQGMALLYAMLLVSIVLTVSLSLLNITYKQIVLTAISRESQIAHFAALSALDCVIFTDRFFRDPNNKRNDNLDNPFGVFTFDIFSNPPSMTLIVGNPSPTFTCGNAGNEINATEVTAKTDGAIGSADGVFSRYDMIGLGLNGACATVEVRKIRSGDYDNFGEGDSIDDRGKMMIAAFGYNTCNTTSSRLVERRVRTRSR